MKLRTQLALTFLTANCMLVAAATDAMAGPLPLEVLGPMRIRTVKFIGEAEAKVMSFDVQDREAFETFVKETADPKSLQPGTYEKLLGNYYQQAAEIAAYRAAQQAIITALSSHLDDIDQQIHAWKLMGLTDDEVSMRLNAAVSKPPLTARMPRPGPTLPTE